MFCQVPFGCVNFLVLTQLDGQVASGWARAGAQRDPHGHLGVLPALSSLTALSPEPYVLQQVLGQKGWELPACCQHHLPLWLQHPFVAAHLPLQLQGCVCPRGSRGPEDHHSKAAFLVWVWVSPFPLLLSCRGHYCHHCGTVCGRGLSSTLICALLAAVCWPGHPRQPGVSGPASWLQDKRRLGCRMGLPHFMCAG